MQSCRSALFKSIRTVESARAIHSSSYLNMPIKVGDKIPSVELFENTPAEKVNMSDFCSGKKVVIFGVPGAFTPGCSKTHLPGYVQMADQIKAKGISEIVCVSVNDAFVMSAWGEQQNATGKVRMLADTSGAFTKAIDLELDLAAVLGTVRTQRFAMLVNDGKVEKLEVEPDGKGLTCSLSNNFINSL